MTTRNQGGSCVRAVDTVVNKEETDYGGGDRGSAAEKEETTYEEDIHAAPADDPPVRLVRDPGMPT